MILGCKCWAIFPPSHIIFLKAAVSGEGLSVQHRCGSALIILGFLVASVTQIKLCEQTVSAFISMHVIQKCCSLFQMQLWGVKFFMQSNIQVMVSSSGRV